MAKIFAPIKLSENISKTPEGFLLCRDVAITRLGELVYADGETPIDPDADGKVVIERTEQDVFDKTTIASFEGKALTVNHPKEFVSPDNWADLAVGHVSNVHRGDGDDKDKLLADVLVTDAIAISLINNGLREVSCGYEAEYIQTEKGRGRQTKIVGNHLALVDKGRAGATCAIMDHEGKENKMSKLKDKLKSVFAKAIDEATLDEEAPKKDEKKAEDEGVKSYDELVKMVKDLGEKLDGMKPEAKDESEKKEDPKQKKEGEDEEAGEAGLESRLAKLEKAVAQLLKGEESEDEDSDEEAKDTDEEDETVDDDMAEEGELTSDSISRAEILVPGIKKSKDIKVNALKQFNATADGAKTLKMLNGGKAPAFDSAEKVDTLFVAASELVKASRKGNLSKTKSVKMEAIDNAFDGPGVGKLVTAADLNKKFEAHYSNKK